MRHVVVKAEGVVSVEDAPDPVLPGPDGAIIQVETTSICGSDLHFYEGDLPMAPDGVPVGHEFVGTVVEVGPEVRRFAVGDRVLTASVTGCGHCDGCATGNPVTCVDGPRIFGSGTGIGAGQATLVAVHAADFQMLAIPDGVDDEASLLLTDNLCTGWAGVKRADVPAGGSVIVLGLGTVGLCAVRSALAQGIEHVYAVDPVDGRRNRAVESGAIPLEGSTLDAVMEVTNGRGADAVIDAVATNTTLDTAFSCVRAGGTVSVIGVHDLTPYPLPILTSLLRSVTLRMTTAPVHQTWAELVPLVQSGALRTDGIVTHQLDLEDAAEGYRLAASRSPDCMKVAFRT